MASSKKRHREGGSPTNATRSVPAVSCNRSSILQRLDTTPLFWADVAARFGIAGVDACLCALGREVADAIRSVGESAEAERQRLESLRTTLHVAVDIRIDELRSNIGSAESVKIGALERELERLDAALERTRREHAAARETLTSKSDDEEIAALSAALIANLDGIDALLATLPHGPVEPSLLRLELDEAALFSALRTAGVVLAPRGLRISDIVMRGLPTHVRLGRPLQFELALSDDYPRRAPAELDAAAASLAFHARVDVLLQIGLEFQPLIVTLLPASGGEGAVFVSVGIPDGIASSDGEIEIRIATLAGQHDPTGLLRMRVHVGAGANGMHAPLVFTGTMGTQTCTPVITSDGTLYVPHYDNPDEAVFAANGTPLPPVSLAALGFTSYTLAAAFAEETGTLLLAGFISNLVAVNASDMTLRWSAKLPGTCSGIALLPVQGVVVVSTKSECKLHAQRLSDGVRIASTEAACPEFVSSDPTSGTVYVSTGSNPYGVSAFRWTGSVLVADGIVEAAGEASYGRPLTVMPPTYGRRTSYLIVGTTFSPTLLVLSLPDRRLVHTHKLVGMRVIGLAADPSGTALAVCDRASNAIHVLPWPLPGMPQLLA
jgi:hypothetical protein